MTTTQVAQQYFEAWTAKQYERVRALMADDLTWESPLNSFSRAEDVMPGFKRFADSVKSARLLRLATEGDDAALLYECELPFGALRMTSWLRIEGGKLRKVLLTFDPTALNAAQAVTS